MSATAYRPSRFGLGFVALLAAIAVPATSYGQESTGTISITAALVLPDLTVRPVPLHELELVAERDTTERLSMRTGLDGTTSHSVRPGRYRLRSVQPAALGDSSYRWEISVELGAQLTSIELTNANALVERSNRAASGVGARQLAPEHHVFEELRGGVFRVEAGLGHGSGFLVDSQRGLVVTNDHVVGGQTFVRVQLDSVVRVSGQLVARDVGADLAIIRIGSRRCAACPQLPLASAPPGQPIVLAGERLLAIGYPLSQEITLTSGIASSVRDGAIISDVNINPGNSGGPMLNLAGEVVGINTFGAFASAGPGVSGSVVVSRLVSLLDEASRVLETLPELDDRLLPELPRDQYPLAQLQALADTATPRAYQHFADRSAGRFTVSLSTPAQQFVLMRTFDDQAARDRRRREEQAGLPVDERYAGIKEVRDWHEYVGNVLAPVVGVTVNPKIGETGGSAFGRVLAAGLAGVALQAQYKFQGDVREVRVYRNGVEVEPIRGGHAPQRVYVENRWVALKDVADMGYYILPPHAFAPDENGVPPRVSFLIQDLKNPNSVSAVDFYDATTARVWNDFGPYFEAIGRRGDWWPADERKRSPRVAYSCPRDIGSCSFQAPVMR